MHLLAVAVVATDETRPLIGVVDDQLIDQRFELVALHRLEPMRSGDRLGIAAVLTGRHLTEDLLGLGCREVPAGLHLDQHRQRLTRHGRPVVDGKIVLDPGEHLVGIGPGLDRAEGKAVLATLDDRDDDLVGHRRTLPQPRPTSGGQHRHRRVDLGDLRRGRRERHQVGLLKIAVVVRVLLGTTGGRTATLLVPVAGLLSGCLPVGVEIDMAASLVLDRPAQRAHRVDVLQLAASAQLIGTRRTHRDVGVDSHRTLLHLGVADLDGEEDVAQLRDIGLRVLDGADIRPAHDLDERHTGAVVVDQGVGGVVDSTTATDVGGLAGVLFDVGSLDTDDRAVGEGELAIGVGRLVVLRGLKVLGHVGIEVVLPRHDRRADLTTERPAEAHGELDRLFVHHRQRSGQADAGRAGQRVGSVAEFVLAAAEQLRLRGEFDMDLEADDELPLLGQGRFMRGHDRLPWPGAAASSAAAA